MTPQRVNVVTLGVRDLGRARRFYDALGWQAAAEAEGVVFYQMQGAVLALFGRDALARDQGRPADTLGTGAVALAQNFASTAEVDAVFEAAVAAGAQALKPPQETFWGGYGAYFADPDGHVWELAMNPFWSLDESGALTIPAG